MVYSKLPNWAPIGKGGGHRSPQNLETWSYLHGYVCIYNSYNGYIHYSIYQTRWNLAWKSTLWACSSTSNLAHIREWVGTIALQTENLVIIAFLAISGRFLPATEDSRPIQIKLKFGMEACINLASRSTRCSWPCSRCCSDSAKR